MSFAELWQNVTDGQATIISAILTVFAAVMGVSLGSWLFGGRVKDLKSALTQSEQLLTGHRNQVEATLEGITMRLESLGKEFKDIDEQFTGIQEALGQLRGSVEDIEDAGAPADGDTAADIRRRQLREQWASIRDKLEGIAASREIDGRKRAKYGRIDRRRYANLIEALNNDQKLGEHAALYNDAVALWQQHRNGRRIPTIADAQRMTHIYQTLVQATPQGAQEGA